MLGTGILNNYPSGSEYLRKRILDKGGAIISEYLPNQKYSRESFIHRNRLQTGLSKVVIPIEWARRSGTAHTVGFAKKQKKKIICLRMPDWEKERQELLYAYNIGAQIFTVPGQEKKLFEAISSGLNNKSFTPGTLQLSLFD